MSEGANRSLILDESGSVASKKGKGGGIISKEEKRDIERGESSLVS